MKKVLFASGLMAVFATLFTGTAQATPDIIGHGTKTTADYRATTRYVDVVDGDVRFTRDGVPVISHDAKFGGRCNFSVKKYKYKKLMKISRQRGCDIPTLDYVAKIAKANGKRLSLEYKTSPTKKQIRKTGKVLARHGMKSRTVIYSFKPSVVRKVQRAKIGVKTGINVDHLISAASVRSYGGYIAVQINAVTPESLKPLVNAPGVNVSVYTARSAGADYKAVDLNADGVYTDYPSVTAQNMNARK